MILVFVSRYKNDTYDVCVTFMLRREIVCSVEKKFVVYNIVLLERFTSCKSEINETSVTRIIRYGNEVLVSDNQGRCVVILLGGFILSIWGFHFFENHGEMSTNGQM